MGTGHLASVGPEQSGAAAAAPKAAAPDNSQMNAQTRQHRGSGQEPPWPAEAATVLDNLSATLDCIAQIARQSDAARLEQAAKNLHKVLQEESSIKFLENLRSSRESSLGGGTGVDAGTGGPNAVEADGNSKEKEQENEQDLSALVTKLVGIVIFFPLGISLVCFLACGPVTSFEDWDLVVAFNYVVSTACGTAPVGDASRVAPETTQGALILALVATWTLGVTGLLVGYVSSQGAVVRYLDFFSSVAGSSELGKLGMILLQILVLGPLLVLFFSIILGGLLAAAEGWAFSNGILYMLGDTTGQPNPLVSNSPDTSVGMILTLASAMWGFVATSTVIGLASSMESPDWGALGRELFRKKASVANAEAGSQGQLTAP